MRQALEERYRADECPLCKTVEIEVGTVNDTWQELSCGKCGAFWIEEYKLQRVHIWKNGDDSGRKMPCLVLWDTPGWIDEQTRKDREGLLNGLRLGIPLGLLCWSLVAWAYISFTR